MEKQSTSPIPQDVGKQLGVLSRMITLKNPAKPSQRQILKDLYRQFEDLKGEAHDGLNGLYEDDV